MTGDSQRSRVRARSRRRTDQDHQDQVELANLAAELRMLRERSGMTLRELERHTYASDSALSRYLAGRSLPPWQVVDALCRHGGGSAGELRTRWERAWQARRQSPDQRSAAHVTLTTGESHDAVVAANRALGRTIARIRQHIEAAIDAVADNGNGVPEPLRAARSASNTAVRDHVLLLDALRRARVGEPSEQIAPAGRASGPADGQPSRAPGNAPSAGTKK